MGHSAVIHQLDDWALHQSRACVSHAAYAQHPCVQHVRTCSSQHEQMLSGRCSRPAHPYHALLKPGNDTVEIFKSLSISIICLYSAISNDEGAKQSSVRLEHRAALKCPRLREAFHGIPCCYTAQYLMATIIALTCNEAREDLHTPRKGCSSCCWSYSILGQ